ncbi:MAG TPA: SDR family NAD(P)-dependent oxidoreductase, partial [Streptosporangiaceae bacterium]
EPATALTAAAAAWTRGAPADWPAIYAPARPATTPLPTYPFQHQTYWLNPPPAAASAGTADKAQTVFWAAVERADVAGLASMLRVSTDQPLSDVVPALSSWRRHEQERSAVDGWRYRVVWRPVAAAPDPLLSGTWLIVIPVTWADSGWSDGCMRALTEYGAHTQQLVVDAAKVDRGWLAGRLRELSREGEISGVLSLLALDDTPHPCYPALPAGVAATMTLVQAMIDADVAGRLWATTEGGVRTGRDDPLTRPHQAQVWGLGRVVALEQPKQWGGLIDLPDAVSDSSLARVAAALTGIGHEDQIAVRSSGTYVRRLVRAPLGDGPAEKPWRPHGTVLITGGTGGIGSHIARWSARNGAEHLLLTSRQGPDAPGAAELAVQLTELGARVTIAPCDVTNRDALARLIANIPADVPLTAVVHTAGVAQQFTNVSDTSLEEFTAAISAKVIGATHLDELLGETNLDAFILFSSSAGVWGSGHNGAYAAGNSFLDSFAERRSARGRPTTAIAWGAWGGDGMATIDGIVEYMGRRGVRQMPPELAITAMTQAIEHNEASLTVADLDWGRFVRAFTSGRPSPLLDEIPEAQHALEKADAGADAEPIRTAITERLHDLSADGQTKLLLEAVCTEIAAVLRHSTTDTISTGKTFMELGFDSLTAIELRNRLASATGLKLGGSVIFDHPTPVGLARYLRAELLQDHDDDPTSIFAELDTLERSISRQTMQRQTATQIAEKLEDLARKLRHNLDDAENVDSNDDLDSASAEEMFQLIDQELGGS